ncbi:MAG: DUF4143 domain-containing protein [Coprobacillus sp.]|nr:DUF4143 domain-containing protein [Coprobacillus sp.]
MKVDNYIKRIADDQLDRTLHTIGAVLITGPKQCGKTTTALVKANTVLNFDDENDQRYFMTNKEDVFLMEPPLLFDEWQEGKGVWDATRRAVDFTRKKGLVILTGSINEKGEKIHSGAGRITEMKMYPMSLYESGESNGTISLKELFDNPTKITGGVSSLSVNNLIKAICRGGWPASVTEENEEYKYNYAQIIYDSICSSDIRKVDGVKRNKAYAKAILKVYSTHICQPGNMESIYKEIKEITANTENVGISKNTFNSYLNVLRNLYVIDEVDAWCPNIRSRTSLIFHKKLNLVDPSLAVAALGIGPEYFRKDFNTLGFLFESLCIRDLRVYIEPLRGELSYFRTREGLECDAVIHLRDGRYALIECKLTNEGIEKGIKSLNTIEEGILEHDKNEKNTIKYGKPAFKAILTGGKYCYKKDDVYIIPIGCLKN